MRIHCKSLKCLITAITVGMGVICMLFALLTGGLYRDLTLRGQADEISHQIQQKTQDALQRLMQHALQFGVILGNQPDFRKHFSSRDWGGLNRFLMNQYGTPLFSSGVLDVVQVNIYDSRLRLMNRANKPEAIAGVDCGRPSVVRQEEANASTKVIEHAICLDKNRLYFTSITPFEVDTGTVYLEVVSNLAYNLELLEEDMDMPLRAYWKANAAMVYQSSRWPTDKKLEHMVLATYEAPIASMTPVLRIETAQDIAYLSEALNKAGLTIIAGTGAVTIVIIMAMLLIARYVLLGPISAVVSQMRDIRRDQSRLGETITARGTSEIRELAENFNAMSTELKGLYQRLEDSAMTDALTRLGNRKQFNASFSGLIGPQERRATPFALLIIDLDKFKQINDTFGHKVGDQFLTLISERFVNELRAGDSLIMTGGENGSGNRHIARIGGDEFAVLLSQVDSEEKAVTVAKKLAAVANAPFALGELILNVGISIGIVLCPRHGRDKEVLEHKADVAMYQAKKAGGGYVVYSESLESGHYPAAGRVA